MGGATPTCVAIADDDKSAKGQNGSRNISGELEYRQAYARTKTHIWIQCWNWERIELLTPRCVTLIY